MEQVIGKLMDNEEGCASERLGRDKADSQLHRLLDLLCLIREPTSVLLLLLPRSWCRSRRLR